MRDSVILGSTHRVHLALLKVFCKRFIPLALFSMLRTSLTVAHEGEAQLGVGEGFEIKGTVATSYRSMPKVEDGQRWIIPGFLMGGEALPMPKGFSLDEVMLSGSFGEDESYALVSVGQHAGSLGAEIEHAYVGRHLGEYAVLEIGRMSGVFTPYNSVHPSRTRYSDTLLLYDALWGRQYNDNGLRLRTNFPNIGLEAGIEAWQGKSFPSKRTDKNDGAYNVFLRYALSWDTMQLRLGTFYYRGHSDQRRDDRYNSEHSHGVVTTTVPVYSFDGKTENYGVNGQFELTAWGSAFGTEGELQFSTSTGNLRDISRISPIKINDKIFWFDLYHQRSNHVTSICYERLKFKNDLQGAAAGILSEQAQLAGEKDPFRLTVAHNYLWDKNTKVRWEWIRDFSTTKQKDSGLLGVVWMKGVRID